MIAAWYDRQGPPAEVLQVGELPQLPPPLQVYLGVSPPGARRQGCRSGAPRAQPRAG